MSHRFHGRTALLPALLAVVAAAVAVPSAVASPDESLRGSCYFEERILMEPALLLSEEQDVSYESMEPGVLMCTGTVAGQPIVGPGWFTDEGKGRGSCLDASGTSRVRGGLPVASGEEIAVTGVLYLGRVGVTGEAHGFIGDHFFAGSYVGYPSDVGPDAKPKCTAESTPSPTMVRGEVTMVPAHEAVTAPPPHSLTAKPAGHSVKLSWEAADESGRPPIEGFYVYRDGWRVVELDAGARGFLDEGLDRGSYTYEVAAVGRPYESRHVFVTAEVKHRGR